MSGKIDTLIVDDESGAQSLMVELLEIYCPELSVAGIADSADQALKLVNKVQPDLVFLDVQMPHKTGFDFLTELPTINFEVIFVTAHDQYAIKAIKWSALDYLLKPVDTTELREAVDRFLQSKPDPTLQERMKVMRENHFEAQPKTLMLPTAADGFKRVNIHDIKYLEGERNYTWIHFDNAPKLLVSKSLKEYEDLLPSSIFFRCHKSFLINLGKVGGYKKGRDAKVMMRDGMLIKVSRARKEELLHLLQTHAPDKDDSSHS